MFDDAMDARAGPPQGEPLASLLYALDALRERFKDAVARLIGCSAAQALARLVRRLLGCDDASGGSEPYGGAYRPDDDYRRWGDDEDDEDFLGTPRPAASRQPTLLAGLLALLSWLAPVVAWVGALVG